MAKCEWVGLGSCKSRTALGLIEAAEQSGALRPGGTIVEASGGNTAAALAKIAAIKGYKFYATI